MAQSWHAGDTKPDLEGSTGTDLNVAGTTAEIHVRTSSGTLITRAATVPAGTTGAWSLPWLVSELDTPGVYISEVQVERGDGSVQTYPGPSFRVRPQLDGLTPPFAPPLSVVDNGDGTVTIAWS